MSKIINWLNENQGLITALSIILPGGGIIAWLFKRKEGNSIHKDSPYISANKNVAAGGDIIVGGQKTQLINERRPGVIVKLYSFTYKTGRLGLTFKNTGSSTAVIQDLRIAGNDMNIQEIILSPEDLEITRRFNIGGLKILREKIDEPKIELTYKDFSTGKKYRTTGVVTQEPRADGNFNFGQIKDVMFSLTDNNSNNRNTGDSQISKLERRVLEKLYNGYKETGARTKWKATDAFKELGIKDGQYIGALHDSKFINIELDGTHECFVITPEGIRYMDNQ